MLRTATPLTDTTVKNAKPKEKPYKLADGDGLYLIVQPVGSKLWRQDYCFEGQRKTLSFGAYPAIGLKDARDRRDDAKKLLANGADPCAVKKAQKAADLERTTNSFEAVAKKWFEAWQAGVSPKTAERVLSNLERYIFPNIGGLSVADVKPKVVLEVLAAMRARGLGNSMEKAKIAISQVMRHAVQNELPNMTLCQVCEARRRSKCPKKSTLPRSQTLSRSESYCGQSMPGIVN
jgi:hypothetical protein